MRAVPFFEGPALSCSGRCFSGGRRERGLFGRFVARKRWPEEPPQKTQTRSRDFCPSCARPVRGDLRRLSPARYNKRQGWAVQRSASSRAARRGTAPRGRGSQTGASHPRGAGRHNGNNGRHKDAKHGKGAGPPRTCRAPGKDWRPAQEQPRGHRAGPVFRFRLRNA